MHQEILAGIQILTHRLSEFEILNDVTIIIQNWPVSRLNTNIFYNLNVADEHK